MKILHSLLDERPPLPIPEPILMLLDKFMEHKKVINASAEDIPTLEQQGNHMIFNDKIAIWRGDITTIKADAIVNAANTQLLGCFNPRHKCIDNAINFAAGPQLRKDCNTIMEKQGFNEPTGIAKITRGHHLPSSFVIHTVGPIVQSASPSDSDAALLASCYRTCLDVANLVPEIHTIVFCSISTGVFGYPIEEAARVAVPEVVKWLFNHNGQTQINKVIFDVFSEKDHQIYSQVFSEMEQSYPKSQIALKPCLNVNPNIEPTPEQDRNAKKLASFFKSATHVVIGAAAGLSADAGLDYSNTEEFARMYHSLFALGSKSKISSHRI